MITISDLNNQIFYKWLYSKIIKLEQDMAKFLISKVDERLIKEKAEEISNVGDNTGLSFEETLTRHKEETLTRHKYDANNNTDLRFIEYLYFSQLIILIKEFRLYNDLGYKKAGDFEENNSKIKETRNIVAHPVKSIVSGEDSLENIWKGLRKINELIEKLTYF